MRYGMRLALALGFVGVIAMTAVAFGTTDGDEHASPQPSAGAERHMRRWEAKRHWFGERGPHKGGFRRLVHSETKIQLPDGGFGRLVVDHGTITGIDDGSKSLTLKRADGQTVTVTAANDTVIRRGRARAAFDALKKGDAVRVVQVDKGDGLKVRLIAAPEPRADDEAAHEETSVSEAPFPGIFEVPA